MRKTTLNTAILLALGWPVTALAAATNTSENATDTNADAAEANASRIERIKVRGDFRARGIEDVAGGLSVLSADDLQQRDAEHLEQALAMAPNVNLAAGASRARFFQIRGIGERSQFVDPRNPSVGLVVDGINYSGLGNAGQLFDIGQVEVFRGPQSTRFGADGMAGMIYLDSTATSYFPEGQLEVVWANYNTYAAGVAFGNAVTENLRVRGSIYQHVSDGFMDNIYLGRSDTQDQDELTVRLNADWELSDDLTAELTWHHLDIDNGYDAWSLNQDRTTLSDEPGRDTLDSHAGRVGLRYTGWAGHELQFSTSLVSADSIYSFDEDWAYVGIAPDAEYSSFDAYFRERDQLETEARWLSAEPVELAGVATDWVAGVYHQRRDQDLTREYTFLAEPFQSTYETRHSAIYGELQQQWTDQLRLTYGLRYEDYSNDYVDSRGVTANPSDSAWGGRASLQYRPQAGQRLFVSAARGFKGGGVNGEALGRMEDEGLEEVRDFLESRASFAPEYLTSLEAGYHLQLPEHSLQLQLTAFYSWRDDMQANAYVEREATFVTYMDNAAEGRNYGLEAELNYLPSDQLRVFANLGLLETELRDFELEDGTVLHGREQAHAPGYQLHTGFEYQLAPAWDLRVEMDARDSFYFSNSHDERSSAYQLYHLRLNYNWQQWQFSLWARNVLNEDYETRGFYFGNDPRDGYSPKNYVQYGEPRRVGLTARYTF